jgi:hypothetical protein
MAGGCIFPITETGRLESAVFSDSFRINTPENVVRVGNCERFHRSFAALDPGKKSYDGRVFVNNPYKLVLLPGRIVSLRAKEVFIASLIVHKRKF